MTSDMEIKHQSHPTGLSREMGDLALNESHSLG